MSHSNLQDPPAPELRHVSGPTILLGSGNYYSFLDPAGSEITIEDIAYSLGYDCRFRGQCVSRVLKRRVFYSVAEHCVRMSRVVPSEVQYDALMHELGEGPCGDMSGPLKQICPDFKAVEKRCEVAETARFHVPRINPQLIKHYDMRMLATERRDLMPWRGERWAVLEGVEPLPFEIIPWLPDAAAEAFLRRYEELRPEAAPSIC